MKKNLKVTFATLCLSANAHAMAPRDITDEMGGVFLQLGFGGFTLEKYLVAVAISFVSFFLLPYLAARLNGSDRNNAKYLGLQGLFGGFLVAGVFTAPIGLIVVGLALFKSFSPPEPDAH